MNKIGILAYGSLINEPGPELQKYIIKKEKVTTPFKIEFARESKQSRDGAPTLVPVEKGGAKVESVILVLEGVSAKEAKDMLYRREINKVEKLEYKYIEPSPEDKGKMRIIELPEDFYCDVKTVFYTKFDSNINNLDPKELAKLAIKSAKMDAGRNKRDGISYLIDIKSNNIETPIMMEYEEEICSQVSEEYKTKIESLEEAWNCISKNTH